MINDKLNSILVKLKEKAGVIPNVETIKNRTFYAEAYKGKISISNDLIKILSEPELAFVICHELSHLLNDDPKVSGKIVKGLSNNVIDVFSKNKGFFKKTIGLIAEIPLATMTYSQLSQLMELRADKEAIMMVEKLGYNKNEALKFFSRVDSRGNHNLMANLFSSHPSRKTRLDALKEMKI